MCLSFIPKTVDKYLQEHSSVMESYQIQRGRQSLVCHKPEASEHICTNHVIYILSHNCAVFSPCCHETDTSGSVPGQCVSVYLFS